MASITVSGSTDNKSYFTICSPMVTADGNNIINCNSSLPNSYWDKETPCHDGEKEMFNQLEMDAWNSFGIDMTYYIADWNVDYDRIYGEDRDRHILRKFSFKGFIPTYPEEKQRYTNFGIDGLDSFSFWSNISHFSFASRFDDQGSTCYDEYIAQEGDIIKFDYSGLYYEVMHVVKSANQFLQTQHSYTIVVRVFRDIHLTLSPLVSSDPLSAFTDKPKDIFDISDDIDDEKLDFLFNTSAANEEPITPDPHPPVNDDPFGGW
jgi:hypothetical protein